MKTLILILKGILFYSALTSIVIWISAIDSLLENGYFIIYTLCMIFLTLSCKIISYEELKIITFTKKKH